MAKKRNRVVQILMDRDEITEKEAEALLDECRAELDAYFNGARDYYDADEIIEDILGLEPDYIFDILV